MPIALFWLLIAAAVPRDTIPAYVPHRVYDSHAKKLVDFEAMLAKLVTVDAVFFGEEHHNPGTHRLERALLEGVRRRRGDAVVALEMFERDTQGVLDEYLAGQAPEADFLARSRPWPNYPTDYRPLVEWAKDQHWPVVASNVPRRHATTVARGGVAALDSVPGELRSNWAAALECPTDDYYRKFKEAMGSMEGHGPGAAATPNKEQLLERMYQAQCVKDETMGESSARAWQPGRLLIHFNGSFHSDFRLGTVARFLRRQPDARVVVISAVPVADLDRIDPKGDDRKRADYLVYVLQPPADSVAR